VEKRTLTISIDPDWRSRLRAAARRAEKSAYQGETLNFQREDEFFSMLNGNRWRLLRAIMSAGETGVRELARRIQRDVRRVHDDIVILQNMGLVERTKRGKVLCPYDDIHVDIHVDRMAA